MLVYQTSLIHIPSDHPIEDREVDPAAHPEMVGRPHARALSGALCLGGSLCGLQLSA